MTRMNSSQFYDKLLYLPEIKMYVGCLDKDNPKIFLYNCEKQQVIARELNRYTGISINSDNLKTISFYFMDTGILVCNTIKVPLRTTPNGRIRYQQARVFYFIDYNEDE